MPTPPPGPSRRAALIGGLALACPWPAGAQTSPAAGLAKPRYKSYALLALRETRRRGREWRWLLRRHGPAAAGVPGVKGCIVSEVVQVIQRPDVAPFRIGPFQAVIETWFDSPEAHAKVLASDAWKGWVGERAGHATAGRTFFAEEHWYVPLKGVVRPAAKGFGLLMRKDGLGADDFRRAWIEVHGPMAASVPGMRGFAESYVLDEDQEGLPPLELEDRVDGFPMTFSGDAEETKAADASDQMKAWRAHGAGIFGKSRPTQIAERFVMSPQA